MTFLVIILTFLTIFGIIGCEPICFSKEGIRNSKGQKTEKGFLIALGTASAFAPIIWPLMALFGVEFSYDIARCIMTLEAFFFFIGLFRYLSIGFPDNTILKCIYSDLHTCIGYIATAAISCIVTEFIQSLRK